MSLPKDPLSQLSSSGGASRSSGDGGAREGSREIHHGIIVSEAMDWCRKGGAIVPYRLWAKQIQAGQLANSVRQTDDRSHVVGSLVLVSHGDAPGAFGIHSGTNNAECTPMTWSATVRAEGRNMVRHDDLWWMNHKNTYGRLTYVEDPSGYPTPDPQLVKAKMQVAQGFASDGPLPITEVSSKDGDSNLPPSPSPPSSPQSQAATVAPEVPDETDEDGLSIKSKLYRSKKLLLQSLTGTPWVRVTIMNPCYNLRCGKLLHKYRGGAYGCVGGHHMPADSVSPLPRDAGPAIQMDDADHEQTGSYGSSKAAYAYRGTQLHVLLNGNFMGANRMDIIDINSKFPDGRYTDAMGQMADYLLCLKRTKQIN